ncbi:hypothetical protein D3C85_1843000 [compost metagenome]
MEIIHSGIAVTIQHASVCLSLAVMQLIRQAGIGRTLAVLIHQAEADPVAAQRTV